MKLIAVFMAIFAAGMAMAECEAQNYSLSGYGFEHAAHDELYVIGSHDDPSVVGELCTLQLLVAVIYVDPLLGKDLEVWADLTDLHVSSYGSDLSIMYFGLPIPAGGSPQPGPNPAEWKFWFPHDYLGGYPYTFRLVDQSGTEKTRETINPAPLPGEAGNGVDEADE